MDKPVTIIVSDLHLGGGPADPGDDHVYQESQFVKLITEKLLKSPEGQAGNIELFINGDFLDFAQVNQEAYTLGSAKYWCSETESLEKLEVILNGHADIFAALKLFQTKDEEGHGGNSVTIAPGNHDVDLYWPKVQARLSEVAGPINFELKAAYHRHDGLLEIHHGHMFDPANRFKSWENPIGTGPDDIPRLEMCPGTLFMVKFVNRLEEKYPFADNIKPPTRLVGILRKGDFQDFGAFLWLWSRFSMRHPGVALEVEQADADFGALMESKMKYDDDFVDQVVNVYRRVRDPNATPDSVRSQLSNEDAIQLFLYDLLAQTPPDQWAQVFKTPSGTTLGIGGATTTLSVLRSGMANDKEVIKRFAEDALDRTNNPNAPEVVVMGHTHQPDRAEAHGGKYFNTGSWTRYCDLEKEGDLTMAKLQDELAFPYQLNYVRVERLSTGHLQSEMICFDEKAGYGQ